MSEPPAEVDQPVLVVEGHVGHEAVEAVVQQHVRRGEGLARQEAVAAQVVVNTPQVRLLLLPVRGLDTPALRRNLALKQPQLILQMTPTIEKTSRGKLALTIITTSLLQTEPPTIRYG